MKNNTTNLTDKEKVILWDELVTKGDELTGKEKMWEALNVFMHGTDEEIRIILIYVHSRLNHHVGMLHRLYEGMGIASSAIKLAVEKLRENLESIDRKYELLEKKFNNLQRSFEILINHSNLGGKGEDNDSTNS